MNPVLRSTEGDLFRLAFDLSPSGMLAVDSAGTILLANRETERLFGYGPGELVGHSVDELVPGQLRAGHGQQRTGYFHHPEARRMGAGRDLFGLRRDGTEVPVEIGLSPVRTPEGLVVIASVVDISARREAERALRESEERSRQSRKLEAIGTLAGGIAHDFNNVLLAIVGYAELALRALPAESIEREDLDHVLRAAERGRRLVQRILAFSRKRDLARVPTNMERVVREAFDLLRASLPSSIELVSSLDPKAPMVLADETQMHQVIMNLATNSAYALPSGGTIQFQLAPFDADEAWASRHPGMKRGRHARLSVIDDGAGMSAEVRERMFEPFFTTKPVGEGTGLGLAVALGIVQSFDGAIEVQSTPGHGTRVDLWLPASEAVASSTLSASTPVAWHEHVLFVEDEVVLAAMQRRQLESLGFRVTVHTSSLEALADFRSRPDEFDLVVTDNTMPRMTGLVLARELKALRPELPVLMVTGYAGQTDPEVLRAHGVNALLGKPHTARELKDAILGLLGPS